MSGFSLKRWFASAFSPVGFARPFRQYLKGSLVPDQANACQNAFCVGGNGAWHGIEFACALAVKNRELHSVQFLSDAGRTHRVATSGDFGGIMFPLKQPRKQVATREIF